MKLTDKQKKLIQQEIDNSCWEIQQAAKAEKIYLQDKIIEIIEKRIQKMIKFEFDSHEQTSEDQYVKEVVTFKFTADNESWYVPYFHKTTKEGGSFWSSASAGVQVYGKKKFYEGFMLDSRHRSKQVIDFLNERRWEKQIAQAQTQGSYYPHGMTKQASVNDYSHGDGLAINSTPPKSMDEVVSDQLPF